MERAKDSDALQHGDSDKVRPSARHGSRHESEVMAFLSVGIPDASTPFRARYRFCLMRRACSQQDGLSRPDTTGEEGGARSPTHLVESDVHVLHDPLDLLGVQRPLVIGRDVDINVEQPRCEPTSPSVSERGPTTLSVRISGGW